MLTNDADVNTPAVAWAWLRQRIADLDEKPGFSIADEWRDFRSKMDGEGTRVGSGTDWPSDFWIAKTHRVNFSLMEPVWAIPGELDQWPSLGLQESLAGANWLGQKSNYRAFRDILAGTDSAHISPKDEAIWRFIQLSQSSTFHGDPAMVSTNQIRAWVDTAFGGLLGGVAFTPTDDEETRQLVLQAVKERIVGVDSAAYGGGLRNVLDYGCEALYNLRMGQDGIEESGGMARQGQGSEWQQSWKWLSGPQDAPSMRATLQLAGQLLVNGDLFDGLTWTLLHGDEESRLRALCVTRRWLLTAKALAWVFEALRHDWTMVRPQDLACFAFGALSPTWPRRSIAISHRSAEAKPLLSTLNMWSSPHAAIDASYVPAWETNIGMIWSLFAPAPMIARVKSPHYLESEWCRREDEMLQYLLDSGDFLEGRIVVDMGVDQLAALDVAIFQVDSAEAASPPAQTLPLPNNEFPPFSLVLVGQPRLAVELTILRAGGALRLIHALVRDPAKANQIAGRLVAGGRVGIDAPTNNPDGWAPYAESLRELETWAAGRAAKQSIAGKVRRRFHTPTLSLRLPADYSESDLMRDIVAAEQIPDLSDGRYSTLDILVALEWRRTAVDWFEEEGHGDKVLVDVTDISVEQWTTTPDVSLARGLLALNALTPTWILQHADQNAHMWAGFSQQPIFTKHVENQFGWLKPVFMEPLWLIYYLANSGLTVEPNLQAAMIAAVVHSGFGESLHVEQEGDGARLTVPVPNEFFVVPTDALQDLADLGVHFDE